MNNSSQRKKAVAALQSKKTNIFNNQYSTSGEGILTPISSFQTFQSMFAKPQSRTRNEIIAQALRNRAATYGIRSNSPTNPITVSQSSSRSSSPNLNPTTVSSNTNTSRSSSPNQTSTQGGKSRKYIKTRRRYSYRRKSNRRSTCKN